MHELAIARRLVAEALQRMEAEGGDRLATVEAVLGATGQLSAESVRQHFELAARGTPAERAVFQVTWAPARYCCFDWYVRVRVPDARRRPLPTLRRHGPQPGP